MISNCSTRLVAHVRNGAGALCILLTIGSSIPFLQSTSLRPLNLVEIVQESKRIFVGECLSASDGRDSNGLPHSSYVFRITEIVKGNFESDIVTIKHFGVRRTSAVRLVRIEGMPEYEPGLTYLLLYNDVSQYGFSAPIGLMQGAFRVLGAGSSRRVINGVNNLNLVLDTTKGVGQRLAERRRARTSSISQTVVEGPVSYSAFLSNLRMLAKGEQLSLIDIELSLQRAGGGR